MPGVIRKLFRNKSSTETLASSITSTPDSESTATVSPTPRYQPAYQPATATMTPTYTSPPPYYYYPSPPVLMATAAPVVTPPQQPSPQAMIPYYYYPTYPPHPTYAYITPAAPASPPSIHTNSESSSLYKLEKRSPPPSYNTSPVTDVASLVSSSPTSTTKERSYSYPYNHNHNDNDNSGSNNRAPEGGHLEYFHVEMERVRMYDANGRVVQDKSGMKVGGYRTRHAQAAANDQPIMNETTRFAQQMGIGFPQMASHMGYLPPTHPAPPSSSQALDDTASMNGRFLEVGYGNDDDDDDNRSVASSQQNSTALVPVSRGGYVFNY